MIFTDLDLDLVTGQCMEIWIAMIKVTEEEECIMTIIEEDVVALGVGA